MDSFYLVQLKVVGAQNGITHYTLLKCTISDLKKKKTTTHNSHTPSKMLYLYLTFVRICMTLLFLALDSPKLWRLKAQILKSEAP